MKIRFSSFLIGISIVFALVCLINTKEQGSGLYSGWQGQFQPLKFGSNKPHLLFHVGSRDAITYNMAYGYWLQKPEESMQKSASSTTSTGMFSDLRFKYQNTEEEIYVNMLNNDGQKLIWEEIKDNRYRVETDVRYMYERDEKKNEFGLDISWSDFHSEPAQGQQDIFNNSKVRLKGDSYYRDYQQGDLTWFMALSVENNELKLINHKDYLSPMCFTLQRNSQDQIQVHLQQLSLQENKQYDYERKQTFSFLGHNLKSLNMFGFTVNISEAYQSHNYLNEIKHLIELEKYPHLNLPRHNDSKIVAWQNKQIEEIKKAKFDSKYTYAVIYGTVDRATLLDASNTKNIDNYPKIHITNSTTQKKFDSHKFQLMAHNNQKSLFDNKLSTIQNQEDKEFVHHVIYNLIGGLAYYEGKLYTQNSIMSHQHDYSFTFTPSRLIFPRSFLWDDGFHNTIMATYKPQLVMKVLHSWFKKVDLFGWIGRQQIRGFEISSMMPDSRFIFQDVFQLNPPTIVMPVLKLLQSQGHLSASQNTQLQTLLENHFPALEKHFRYFLKTQSHYDLTYKEDLTSTIKYRWRCKDECAKGNFMGSGLDDYPRVQQSQQISKEHIDLTSWLWFFSDALQNIAGYLEKQKAARFYNKWKHELRQKVIEECLDETDMLFKDLAVKGPKLFLDQKVTKIGYINLFPFFVGLLRTFDSDPQQRVDKILNVLNRTIEVMMDQKLLMSQGGIRSLSLSDSEYASQQNYWRGASWMPINYMILRACKKYYWDIDSEPHRQQVRSLYRVLREKVIGSVRRNYKRTGYLFQNYIEGEGNRGYPFYGWTSLIASIITEDY